MGRARNPNGRSSIIRRDDGWHGFVSFGTDLRTGRRLRRHVRGQTRAAVAKKVAELERLRYAGYRGSEQTVGEWLDVWLDERRRGGTVRPSTLAGYELDIRCHLRPLLGARRLAQLNAADVAQLWIALRESGRQPPTIHHVRRTLSAALSTAASRGLLGRHPLPLAPHRPTAPRCASCSPATRCAASSLSQRPTSPVGQPDGGWRSWGCDRARCWG